MNQAAKRDLVKFLRRYQRIFDLLILLAILFFLVSYLPIDLLTYLPPTGGDMGSHYWPLITLLEHALPNGSLRVWNPGNLAGETHHLFYFPFPYLVMALIAPILSVGSAFKLSTLLPSLLLPLAVYTFLRSLRFRFPVPIIGAAFSQLFYFNESFSMWGGNLLSTLAGQFAHAFAITLLLFLGAIFAWELRRGRKIPVYSGIVGCFVVLSHSYIAICLPVFLFGIALSLKTQPFKALILKVIITLVITGLLSLWWIVPMLDSAPWTVAFYVYWNSDNFWNETIPKIFYPALVPLIVPIIWLAIKKTDKKKIFARALLALSPTVIFYVAAYFVMPSLGLVDIRAIPQCQLLVLIISGIVTGLALGHLGRVLTWIITPILIFILQCWLASNIAAFPGWAKWNYSGWETKPLFWDLNALSNHLRGTLSDPRVIYENSDLNNKTGTVRVFEMLPYFANRATLESVYLQATLLAPAAFLLQSEVSKTPSCPFIQYPCPDYDVTKIKDRLSLLAVNQIILTSSETIAQADKTDFLVKESVFGPWHVYRTVEQPKLVEILKTKPLLPEDAKWQELSSVPRMEEIDRSDWKGLFYKWLRNYNSTLPLIIKPIGDNHSEINKFLNSFEQSAENDKNCTPKAEASFQGISISTNCPGKPHLLKFAYHGSWQADTGDPLFLVSPGYIAFVPSSEKVILTFGQSQSWRYAAYISILTFLGLIIFQILALYRRKA